MRPPWNKSKGTAKLTCSTTDNGNESVFANEATILPSKDAFYTQRQEKSLLLTFLKVANFVVSDFLRTRHVRKIRRSCFTAEVNPSNHSNIGYSPLLKSDRRSRKADIKNVGLSEKRRWAPLGWGISVSVLWFQVSRDSQELLQPSYIIATVGKRYELTSLVTD